MDFSRIRPIVIALFLYQGKVLVSEAYDSTKQQSFFRPLGGAIEFGEYGEEALRREIREELDAEINSIRYLGMIENVFTYDGLPGHEIVLVYDAAFTDLDLYERDRLTGNEGSVPFEARWLPPSAFNGITPVYPDGLLDFLAERGLLPAEDR